MTRSQKSILHKSARLILLLRLDESGKLENMTLQATADLLGVSHRSTILRDRLLLPALRAEIKRMEHRLQL